jgi:hypothetical protein
MPSNTATRPTSLTSEADLDAEARAWIARNGLPSLNAVQDAINFTEAHGDPNCDNPFRHALLRVAGSDHGARWTAEERWTLHHCGVCGGTHNAHSFECATARENTRAAWLRMAREHKLCGRC